MDRNSTRMTKSLIVANASLTDHRPISDEQYSKRMTVEDTSVNYQSKKRDDKTSEEEDNSIIPCN